MRRDISIAAEPRASRGKNESRRLRKRGLIPAILYGAYQEALAVSVDPKQVTRILHSKTGHNTIFNLDLQDRESSPAMLVDWQYDPMKDTLLHVDLKRIDLSKRIQVSVPVKTQGEAKGVKQQDGLLELVIREVEIECLPDEIPEHFTVDVTELMMGQSVRAGEVALTGSMVLISPAENVIAHVVAMRAEEVVAAPETPEAAAAAATPEAGAAAPAAEPEVIKKGKKEEEGAEAETKGKKK